MYKNFLPPEDDGPQEGSDNIPLPIEIELAEDKGENDE